MGLWRRLMMLFSSKADAALDRFEDPRETLEAAYRKQQAALQDARRGVAEVLTSEKRLELEADALRAARDRSTAAAVDAARAGDDASARRALEREASAGVQRDRFLAEIADIRVQRMALEATAERIRERVEAFRTEKLALGARFAVAKAASRAGETVTGLSDDMADVAGMVERVRDRSRDAQARAAALAELAGAGAGAGDGPGAAEAHIDARLAAIKSATQTRLS